MEKDTALKIWDAIYGKDHPWQLDCFDTYIFRDDYGETEKTRIRPGGDGKQHNYGWEIDHIRPKASFKNETQANMNNNYEPMHWSNNREKADNYRYFTISNKKYRIVECDICKLANLEGYGIIDQNGHRIDWKGRKKLFFKQN